MPVYIRHIGYRIPWTSPAFFVTGFFFLIIFGSFLLSLPISSVNGHSISYVNALFQSTSAVCITGLTSIDISSQLSRFGQIVILILFQIGALGIMTYSLAIVVFVQQRRSPEQNEWLANVFSHDRKLPPTRMLVWIISFTFVIESLGVVALYTQFASKFDTSKAIYYSVFHAVSAFCNAGFSLFANSLIDYQSDLLFNVIVCVLIVAGGLGFVVTFELWRWMTGRRRWFKLLIQTKLVILTYIILMFGGAIFILLFEAHSAQKDMSNTTRVLTAVFQSVTARTAGFNTIDIGTLSNPSLSVLLLLMFIGGAPGSTTGGVKVTTVAVLALAVFARYRSHVQPQVFRRSIPFDTIVRAAALVTGAVAIIMFGTLCLQISELYGISHQLSDGGFLDSLFEASSAFGTVGLSTGITPTLSAPGRFVIMILMFVGRIGPLTIAALLLGKKTTSRVSFVEEDVMIG